MELDIEVVQVEKDYSGQLLLVLIWRLGLSESLHEAVVLMKNGTVLLDGKPARDLNTRIGRKATILVGLRGVALV
jgi:ribosomal protein S4E